MAAIKTLDHLGITVADLDACVEFFLDLGLEIEGRAELQGEFVDAVTGLPGAHTEIVMLRPPGGGTGLELARFLSPAAVPGSPEAMANELGIRSFCYRVEGLRELVARAAARGFGLVGEIGEYEGTWLMAHVRGPEGIVVSLTEQIGSDRAPVNSSPA